MTMGSANNAAVPSYWWEASPNVSNGHNVYYVNTSGTENNNNSSNKYGVPFDYAERKQDATGVTHEGETAKTQRETNPCRASGETTRTTGPARKRQSSLQASAFSYDEPYPLELILDSIRQCAKKVSWKASVLRWMLPCNHFRFALQLKRELDSGRYRLSPYTRFEVTEPKRRTILSPKFRDRVAQRTMLLNGLYDELTRGLIYDCSACLKGKGTLFAVRRMGVMMQRHYKRHGLDGWVLSLDIRKFFESIPHDKLKDMVSRLVSREEYRDRLYEVIDSFDDPGIGLGVEMSHHLANAYLSPLDHFIKEELRIRNYIRYADDMVIIGDDKDELLDAWKRIEGMLGEMGLSLNAKSNLHPFRTGLKFLKFRYRMKPSGRLIRRLDRKSVARFARHLRKLARRVADGEVPPCKIAESLRSWEDHARWGHNNETIRIIRRILPMNGVMYTQEEMERFFAERARLINAQEDTTERDNAEKAIVGAIASLAVKYNALEDLANIGDVSIPALLALANEKGVTPADLQNTMSLVQIYVLQLQAVEGGTWADCWDGLKERFATWLAEINAVN